MHVGILIETLASGKGGAERVAVTLASGLANRGHTCTLFYASNRVNTPAYAIPAGVRCVNVGATLLQGRAALEAAGLDVLCAFVWDAVGGCVPRLCKGLGVPLVWSEHTCPQLFEVRWSPVERQACMVIADAIHLLCESYKDSLPSPLRGRVAVIPNCVSAVAVARQHLPAGRRLRILSVARLNEKVKQLSLLVRAFALLKDEFPDWDCRICGGGPFYDAYTSLIREMGLEGKVCLTGPVEDIASEYAAASLFAFPSRLEGFPLALVEAQASGLPAVGFAACPGVNEIIVHGENGLLAREMTAECLADSLRVLMADEALRERMGQGARTLATRFDASTTLDMWECLLRRTAATPRPLAIDAVDAVEDAGVRAACQKLLNEPLPACLEYWARTGDYRRYPSDAANA